MVDRHGNEVAQEGCDRCACGCKYWERDRCVSCGGDISQAERCTVSTMDTPLLVVDRCDRCGGQAYVRVTLEAGTELLFCGHDWNKNVDLLLVLPGVKVQDETERLRA